MGAIETSKFMVNLLFTVVSSQIFKKDAIQTAPQSLINLFAAIIFIIIIIFYQSTNTVCTLKM